MWSNLWEKESIFLLDNPKLNFIEDLLNTMYIYYDSLGALIHFYEWYNYRFSSDIFFKSGRFFKYQDLIMKILNELEKNDESEISYIVSLNLLKFIVSNF